MSMGDDVEVCWPDSQVVSARQRHRADTSCIYEHCDSKTSFDGRTDVLLYCVKETRYRPKHTP